MTAALRKLEQLSSALVAQDPALDDRDTLLAPSIWTPDDVRDRLREAAECVSRMPVPRSGRPAEHRCCMPDVIHGYWEAYGYTRAVLRPAPPSPAEIQRMDDALAWLVWLEGRQRKVVWMRANALPLRMIAKHVARSYEWVRLLERSAYGLILRRLQKNSG